MVKAKSAERCHIYVIKGFDKEYPDATIVVDDVVLQNEVIVATAVPPTAPVHGGVNSCAPISGVDVLVNRSISNGTDGIVTPASFDVVRCKSVAEVKGTAVVKACDALSLVAAPESVLE